MALMAAGNGNGEIRETVFEERFGTAEELRKLGARIEIQKDRARIHGMYPLRGETVQAADLRGRCCPGDRRTGSRRRNEDPE